MELVNRRVWVVLQVCSFHLIRLSLFFSCINILLICRVPTGLCRRFHTRLFVFTGSYGENAGSGSLSDCTLCPLGRFGNMSAQTSSAACFACLQGQYSDQLGRTSCQMFVPTFHEYLFVRLDLSSHYLVLCAYAFIRLVSFSYSCLRFFFDLDIPASFVFPFWIQKEIVYIRAIKRCFGIQYWFLSLFYHLGCQMFSWYGF